MAAIVFVCYCRFSGVFVVVAFSFLCLLFRTVTLRCAAKEFPLGRAAIRTAPLNAMDGKLFTKLHSVDNFCVFGLARICPEKSARTTHTHTHCMFVHNFHLHNHKFYYTNNIAIDSRPTN